MTDKLTLQELEQAKRNHYKLMAQMKHVTKEMRPWHPDDPTKGPKIPTGMTIETWRARQDTIRRGAKSHQKIQKWREKKSA